MRKRNTDWMDNWTRWEFRLLKQYTARHLNPQLSRSRHNTNTRLYFVYVRWLDRFATQRRVKRTSSTGKRQNQLINALHCARALERRNDMSQRNIKRKRSRVGVPEIWKRSGNVVSTHTLLHSNCWLFNNSPSHSTAFGHLTLQTLFLSRALITSAKKHSSGNLQRGRTVSQWQAEVQFDWPIVIRQRSRFSSELFTWTATRSETRIVDILLEYFSLSFTCQNVQFLKIFCTALFRLRFDQPGALTYEN